MEKRSYSQIDISFDGQESSVIRSLLPHLPDVANCIHFEPHHALSHCLRFILITSSHTECRTRVVKIPSAYSVGSGSSLSHLTGYSN